MLYEIIIPPIYVWLSKWQSTHLAQDETKQCQENKYVAISLGDKITKLCAEYH